MSSIWNTLSSIDCSDHIEKKGQFSYLAWTWAWAMVKEHYPLACYELLDDIVYPDGTMEVRMEVTIPSSKSLISGEPYDVLTHTMWLPVLDFKNKAIQNPNAFDINTARMRCLVKCLAMFGLGHYIYAGESTPAPPKASHEQWEELLTILSNQDSWQLRQFTQEVGQDIMEDLFNMAPTGQKTKFKQQVRDLYAESNNELKADVARIEAWANGDHEYALEDILNDFGPVEYAFVMNALDEVTKQKMKEAS